MTVTSVTVFFCLYARKGLKGGLYYTIRLKKGSPCFKYKRAL
ncbi:hypothetical protein HMPREF9429_00230 [Megasphaera micronuciformis F0359]|uniref:Uncharacterized protein n=1 Tax=Megasphaera micronuciformis F0359 TaxID=706434 RepID=E2Z9X4_9FIRM|nr:hypothetical protein HMPREF9429_00230 [Megasphaera micronuciformis F0359]